MPYADPTSDIARASRKRADAKNYMANKEKHRLAMQVWRENNREYHNAWRKDYSVRYPERKMITAAKGRAKQKGIEFSLSEWDIVIPECCPILDIPLIRGAGRREDSSPSLDRMDNSRGYVPDNVMVISHRANRLKSDATLEEILAIARYMEG